MNPWADHKLSECFWQSFLHFSGMENNGGSRYIEPLQSRGKQGPLDEGSEPGLRNSDCPQGNLAAKAFLKRWQLWRLKYSKHIWINWNRQRKQLQMVVALVRVNQIVLDRVGSHVRVHMAETDHRAGHKCWPPRVAVICLTTAHSNLSPLNFFFEYKIKVTLIVRPYCHWSSWPVGQLSWRLSTRLVKFVKSRYSTLLFSSITNSHCSSLSISTLLFQEQYLPLVFLTKRLPSFRGLRQQCLLTRY